MERIPDNISSDEAKRIEAMITVRETRKPLERIVQQTIFCGVHIRVGDDIHKPYRETGDMVEHTLLALKDHEALLRILDLGSGSGCILLALLKALPNATGLGVDNNAKAIALAQENAQLNNLSSRAEFRLNDWAHNINEHFDVIISNAPRVRTADLQYLMPEMRDYDPHQGLDGGPDGLQVLRLLAADFSRLITTDGFGITQVGPSSAEGSYQVFREIGCQVEIKTNFMGQPCALLYRLQVQKKNRLWNWLRR